MKKFDKKIFLIFLSFIFTLSIFHCLKIDASNNYSVEVSDIKQKNNFLKLIRNYNIKPEDSIKKLGLYRLNIRNKFLLKKIKSLKNTKLYKSHVVVRIHKSKFQNKSDESNLFPYQWDMKQITNNGDSYKLLPKNPSTSDVALIDSGIDFNNPALINCQNNNNRNFVPVGGINGQERDEDGNKKSFTDYFGHGTNVAGQIGGDGPVFGTFPGIKIRSYRVFDENGNSNIYWIIILNYKIKN